MLVPRDWMAIPIVLVLIGLLIIEYPMIVMGLVPLGWILGVCVVSVIVIWFVFDIDKRKKTHYFVTDQRVIVQVESRWERLLRSRELRPSFDLTTMAAPKGTRTIYFGVAHEWMNFWYPPNYPLLDMFQPLAFIYLENGEEVEGIIRSAVRSLDDTRVL